MGECKSPMSKKILFIINIAWAWLCYFYAPYFFSIKFDSLELTNSIFALVFLVVVGILLNTIHFENKRQMVLTHLLGFIYALLTGLGHQLNTHGFTNFRGLFIPVVLYCHLVAVIIAMIWQWLEKTELWLMDNKSHKTIWDWLNTHSYVIAIILFLCWLPCFLSDYPGGFRHDAAAELDQAIIPQYNPAFPLLHSAIITHFLPFIYRITGSYNAGIAIYAVAQMIMIALLYTHIIRMLYKRGINGLVLDLIMIYMGLFPTIAMLVEFTGRDMMFTGLLLYTLTLIYQMMTDREDFFKNYFHPIQLGLMLPLTVYARNNSSSFLFLIALIVIIGIILAFHVKDYPTKTISFGICCITSYIILGFVLTS